MNTPDRPLPKSVYFKHGAYYFVAIEPESGKSKWHKLGRTWGEAFAKYNKLIPQIKNDGYLKRAIGTYRTGDIPEIHLATMLKQSRNNARARGLAHCIGIADLRELAARSGGRCALSGIKFEYGLAKEVAEHAARRKRPWAPSIDRIDSAGGYITGNIRLVCVAVNIARQDFPDSVLHKIAAGISNMAKQQQKERPKIKDLRTTTAPHIGINIS